jgi:hypothetical protein
VLISRRRVWLSLLHVDSNSKTSSISGEKLIKGSTDKLEAVDTIVLYSNQQMTGDAVGKGENITITDIAGN